MADQYSTPNDVSFFTDRTSFPSHYWATLHPPVANNISNDPDQDLTDEVVRLNEIHIDTNLHDPASFREFSYNKSMISPSSRTCSSLLSEMLRPHTDSRPSSPATTHADLMSDHGSISTHSTPPFICGSPKRHTTAVCPDRSVSHHKNLDRPALSVRTSETYHDSSNKPARHISFGGVTTSAAAPRPSDTRRASETSALEVNRDLDLSHEATPVARRCVHFNAAQASREPLIRVASESSEHHSEASSSSKHKAPSIRFAGPTAPSVRSVNSSRRSSVDEHYVGQLAVEDRSRSVSLQTSAASSPVLGSRPLPATCKSTLDAVLRKEALAKVIDTVPEEEEEDQDFNREDDDNDEEDIDDEDDVRESDLLSHVGSDDDGYVEDIESDDDNIDDDIYPIIQADSGTPRTSLNLDIKANNEVARDRIDLPTPVYRTAAPSESDLPDTTDFAPGTLDEDQPACVAFSTAVKDREARRKPTKPQDIDPTFPESGSEEESEDNDDRTSMADATGKKSHLICRSPRVKNKQLFHSPPPAKLADVRRAKSLPRRYSHMKKIIADCKPLRAMTIKQSNENRAQRRREKKEVRHDLRKQVDHNGHEKMKVHACSRKRLIANENPCVIRPVMSI